MITLSYLQAMLLAAIVLVLLIAVLYLRMHNADLDRNLQSCLRTIQKAGMHTLRWRPQPPHCLGLWCVLTLKTGETMPRVTLCELPRGITRAKLEEAMHAKLLLSLGPLPPVSEQAAGADAAEDAETQEMVIPEKLKTES